MILSCVIHCMYWVCEICLLKSKEGCYKVCELVSWYVTQLPSFSLCPVVCKWRLYERQTWWEVLWQLYTVYSALAQAESCSFFALLAVQKRWKNAPSCFSGWVYLYLVITRFAIQENICFYWWINTGFHLRKWSIWDDSEHLNNVGGFFLFLFFLPECFLSSSISKASQDKETALQESEPPLPKEGKPCSPSALLRCPSLLSAECSMAPQTTAHLRVSSGSEGA